MNKLHNLILTICKDKYAVPEMMAVRITQEVDALLSKEEEAIRVDENWIDIPDKRGEYWLSAFCDGRYIESRIITVIDYQRPNRGLEVQEAYRLTDTIPVNVFCDEYYPKAKWLYIPIPNWQALKESNSKGE